MIGHGSTLPAFFMKGLVFQGIGARPEPGLRAGRQGHPNTANMLGRYLEEGWLHRRRLGRLVVVQASRERLADIAAARTES